MRKELKRLFSELEAQGWRIERRKKGWYEYPPDLTKDPVAIHETPSDKRSWPNMMGRLRRSGFIG